MGVTMRIVVEIVMGIRRGITMQVQSHADLSWEFMLSHTNNQHLADKRDKHENLQKIRNPKRMEEIPCMGFFFTMVLPEVY